METIQPAQIGDGKTLVLLNNFPNGFTRDLFIGLIKFENIEAKLDAIRKLLIRERSAKCSGVPGLFKTLNILKDFLIISQLDVPERHSQRCNPESIKQR